MFVYLYVCVCVSMHVCLYPHECVCACVYVCEHACNFIVNNPMCVCDHNSFLVWSIFCCCDITILAGGYHLVCKPQLELSSLLLSSLCQNHQGRIFGTSLMATTDYVHCNSCCLLLVGKPLKKFNSML